MDFQNRDNTEKGPGTRCPQVLDIHFLISTHCCYVIILRFKTIIHGKMASCSKLHLMCAVFFPNSPIVNEKDLTMSVCVYVKEPLYVLSMNLFIVTF